MNKFRMQKFILVIFILFIILLATVFHFQVHFENALTLHPEVDYEVKVSIWRIFFEPIVGLLLYFNRSLYSLEELPLALLWLIIAYVIYSIKEILQNGLNRKKILLKKLINLPLVIGICFAIFVLELFIPLPNNTIVNNSKDSILVTTHSHTEYSHDGLISQENMLKWHRRNGFDAFFITDHANHKKSLQFVKNQNNKKIIGEPLVMVGQEYSGSNHMSLLGLNGKFNTKGMTDKAVVDSVHKYGGAVIINHWFDGKGKQKKFYQDLGADGFEIENSGSDLYYNRETFENLKKFCEENKLTMVGGLDFHGYGRACSLYNALEIENWNNMDVSTKEQAILSIIKSGSQEKIKILLYKDRPYYSKNNLVIRPFFTVVNYFRTLNKWQVFSWLCWLLLFQFTKRQVKNTPVYKSKRLLFFAFMSASLMIVLAINYYYRGETVKGYSKVFEEYSLLLGPIGLILLLYTLAIVYLRLLRP